MEYTFSQFCTCTEAGYSALQERIDLCARSGLCCEYHPCRMPQGCAPSQCTLVFYRQGNGYLLYFRPSLQYTGGNLLLRHFFSRSCWLFPSFSSLVCALSQLNTSPSSRYEALLSSFRTHIAGQEDALQAVSYKLCGHVSKLAPKRPLSLLFYGPTGVGKSELAKCIAPVLNQSTANQPWRTVWTELNTFTEAHSVYRLTGAPPGYVGYGDPPVLEEVRRSPYTVFLFDELDKAHPNLLHTFMSILDEGRCSAQREDAHGNRELDFRHCIFLFTCNTDLSATHTIGFSSDSLAESTFPESPYSSVPLAHRLFLQDEAARQALIRSGVLREIAGRFQGFIPFSPLTAQARQEVTVHQIQALGQEHGLQIRSVSPDLAAALTPTTALSVRSTASILEGLLTPLFSACAAHYPAHLPLILSGTPQAPVLLPGA